jgi:predicted MFS family arabinose efflux permease
MSRPSDKEKDRGTWVALVLLLAVSLALLLFIGMVFPNLLWVIVIIFGFGVLFALQYLIWGKWLMKHLKERIPDDSEEEEEFLKKYGPQ